MPGGFLGTTKHRNQGPSRPSHAAEQSDSSTAKWFHLFSVGCYVGSREDRTREPAAKRQHYVSSPMEWH